jgi:diguanylate cyclase (GGDEF)-like protein
MNILLVNSVPSFANAVERSLEELNTSVIECRNPDSIQHDITRHSIQIIILNASRSDHDAQSLCKRIRKIKHSSYIYIIVVVEKSRKIEIPNIIESGADDFLFKPFSPEEMLSRFKIAEQKKKLIQNLTHSQKKLIRLVREDAATSLLNRRSLLDETLKEMGRAARSMIYMSAIITRITNYENLFGKINDDIADDVLNDFGRRMKASCRPYDKLGRYSSSDFLLFLPDSGEDNGRKVARRIIHNISSKPFYSKGKKFALTVAVGVSQLNPKDITQRGESDGALVNDILLDSLINRAETALDHARNMGPNSMIVFSQ